jgi:hypothetical protein
MVTSVKLSCRTVAHSLGRWTPATLEYSDFRAFWTSSCFQQRLADVILRIQRRNEMLGLGLVGTIIVIFLVVWVIRRV